MLYVGVQSSPFLGQRDLAAQTDNMGFLRIYQKLQLILAIIFNSGSMNQ